MLITDLSLLFRLLIGHVVGDFLVQTRSMVQEKEAMNWKSSRLYIHAGLYSLVVYLMSSAWAQGVWLIPVLFASHALIDGWKATRRKRTYSFMIDQMLHLAVLVVAFFLLSTAWVAPEKLFWFWKSPRVLCAVLGYLLVLWPFGRLMQVLTFPLRSQIEGQSSRGLESAGFWIGCLERAFLLSFILLNYLPGVALLLGLKSIFRFGEIKDPDNRKEAEYILIGTLLSFGFAIGVGLVIKYISLRLL